jgi:hypothetical protein
VKGKRGKKRRAGKPQEEEGAGKEEESSEEGGTSPSPSQPATREPSREPSPDTEQLPAKVTFRIPFTDCAHVYLEDYD